MVNPATSPASQAAPAAANDRKRKDGTSTDSQEGKKGRTAPATSFEKNLKGLSVQIQGFGDVNGSVATAKALIEHNLSQIALLKEDKKGHKLCFLKTGNITTRPPSATSGISAMWQNAWDREENNIANLTAFSDFVVSFIQATKAARTAEISIDLFKGAVRGLENLRATYEKSYVTGDPKNHEEITEKCIRVFISLSNRETEVDGFLRAIHTRYQELKQQIANEPITNEPGISVDLLISFSHYIQPCIKALQTTTDEKLAQVAKLLKLGNGFFAMQNIPLFLACFFAFHFRNNVSIEDAKEKLNILCGKIIQKREDAKGSGESLEDVDQQILEDLEQTLFLSMIDAKTITKLERDTVLFSHYGELFAILAGVGILGAAATFPATIPGIVVTIGTNGAAAAFKSLYESNKEKLGKLDNLQENQLKGYFEDIEKLYTQNNGKIDVIIDKLTADYENARKTGERLNTLLNFFKKAKDEKAAGAPTT